MVLKRLLPKNDINDYQSGTACKIKTYSYTHSVNNAYFMKEFVKLGVYEYILIFLAQHR